MPKNTNDILEADSSKKILLNYQQQKKAKLMNIIYDFLHFSPYKEHLEKLMHKLNISETDVLNAYLSYNLDIQKVSNTEYTTLANRLILHIHHLITGSWHETKQDYVLNMLRAIAPQTIIEVGFGVPTRYSYDYVLKEKNPPQLTLCDFDETAFQFSEILLSEWDSHWQNKIYFKNANMNDMDHLGNFDVYIFQDCIEHTYDPTAYLKKQVQYSPKHAKFIFILAIGPIIPMHYICWETFDAAVQWLQECGLKIDGQKTISTNPAVDLFALEIPFSFGFFCCSKNV